jgi:uncharacterized protein (TIGR00255 family)
MLLSMTGYGEARHQTESITVAVELRAVNNRYLKVTVRATEPYNLVEGEVERTLRQVIKRGTLQVHLRVRRERQAQDYKLNPVAIRSYAQQLQELSRQGQGEVPLGSLLVLPGVVIEPEADGLDLTQDWQVIEPVLATALEKLQAMRRDEGEAMGQELVRLRNLIGEELGQIRARMPGVVENYRDKLHERVRALLRELDIEIDRNELIKEVAIFAERSDITEEVVRLASHLDQFLEVLREPESPGRKLEFLTQEMFRETNTIGSKANDVEIARHVVEIKGAIEKIRELIQNIE